MGANFGDIDNDGYPDIYLGTGNPLYQSLVPNKMFKNVDGKNLSMLHRLRGWETCRRAMAFPSPISITMATKTFMKKWVALILAMLTRILYTSILGRTIIIGLICHSKESNVIRQPLAQE